MIKEPTFEVLFEFAIVAGKGLLIDYGVLTPAKLFNLINGEKIEFNRYYGFSAVKSGLLIWQDCTEKCLTGK